VWDLPAGLLHTALTGLFWSGWLIALASSFLIDHFDLFGLRQVYLYLRGIDYTPVPFRHPALYRHVRHPLMAGFLIAFWAAPHMSAGRLVFALGMTAYIFIGIALEERDLLKRYGQAYEQYRKQVPMLIPTFRKK
jgi:protein-S-isoprenylcysteine O-methyltransferase Ste14